MLREAQLEAFVAGNLRENEAAEMVRGVRAALPAAPLAAERLPIRRLRRLPPGGATRHVERILKRCGEIVDAAAEAQGRLLAYSPASGKHAQLVRGRQ